MICLSSGRATETVSERERDLHVLWMNDDNVNDCGFGWAERIYELQPLQLNECECTTATVAHKYEFNSSTLCVCMVSINLTMCDAWQYHLDQCTAHAWRIDFEWCIRYIHVFYFHSLQSYFIGLTHVIQSELMLLWIEFIKVKYAKKKKNNRHTHTNKIIPSACFVPCSWESKWGTRALVKCTGICERDECMCGATHVPRIIHFISFHWIFLITILCLFLSPSVYLTKRPGIRIAVSGCVPVVTVHNVKQRGIVANCRNVMSNRIKI